MDAYAEKVWRVLDELKDVPYSRKTEELNNRKIKTRRGRRWIGTNLANWVHNNPKSLMKVTKENSVTPIFSETTINLGATVPTPTQAAQDINQAVKDLHLAKEIVFHSVFTDAQVRGLLKLCFGSK